MGLLLYAVGLYNNKPTAYNDGTTAYNYKPTTHNKYYHIRQLWRSSKWNHLKRNVINQSINQLTNQSGKIVTTILLVVRHFLLDSAALMYFNRKVDNFPNTWYIFFLNIFFLNWLCFIQKEDILPNNQHFFSQYLSLHLMCFKFTLTLLNCRIN